MNAKLSSLVSPWAYIAVACRPVPFPLPSPGREMSAVPGVSLKRAAPGTPRRISIGAGGFQADNLALFDALAFVYEGDLPIMDFAALPAEGFNYRVPVGGPGGCWSRLVATYRRAFRLWIHETVRKIDLVRLVSAPHRPAPAGPARRIILSELIALLEEELGRPVVDQTCLGSRSRLPLPIDWRHPARRDAALAGVGLALRPARDRRRLIAIDR